MTQTINALNSAIIQGETGFTRARTKFAPRPLINSPNLALKYEQKHAADYEKSQQLPIELSSQHNYTEGQTYFYVSYGNRELGYYCRDPWRDGWITFSNYDGSRGEVVTEDEAIQVITQSWRQAC